MEIARRSFRRPLSTENSIKQAKIEAQGIIDRLEPEHISGFPNLLSVLDDCMENAKKVAKIFGQLPE